jgi:glycine reductase
MSLENPGVEFRRKKVYILPSGDSARAMGETIPRLLQFAVKLAEKGAIGPADAEGYLPRGLRFNERVDKTAAQRAVDMVLAKLLGEPYKTEIRVEPHEKVAPPPPLGPLGQATLAVVTEMGFCPHGNPDRIASARATVWGRYSIKGMECAKSDDFMYIHGGYNTKDVDKDPNRGVPVDVLREMEREGKIAKLVDEVFSTCGNGGSLNEMKRMGHEIAQELKKHGVTGVVLPAT